MEELDEVLVYESERFDTEIGATVRADFLATAEAIARDPKSRRVDSTAFRVRASDLSASGTVPKSIVEVHLLKRQMIEGLREWRPGTAVPQEVQAAWRRLLRLSGSASD